MRLHHAQFNHPLVRSKKIEFIEQFNEKLLIKQEGESLQIVDVRTCSVTSVSPSEFSTPSAFIFLFELNLFLTFRQREARRTPWTHLRAPTPQPVRSSTYAH